MKRTLLLLFFLAFCFTGFSQSTKAYTLKELNDLITLKSQLVEKSTKLVVDIEQKQKLIDSCTKKLQTVKAEAAQLKQKVAGKQKKMIKQTEREVESLNKSINEIQQNQTDHKELLEKVSQMVKELDNKIANLSKS